MTEAEHQWTADSVREHLQQTVAAIQQLPGPDEPEDWPALRERLRVEWGEDWARDWPVSRLVELIELDGDGQDLAGWPDRANAHTETVVWELAQLQPEADPEEYQEQAPADEPAAAVPEDEEQAVASAAVATEEVVERIALPALEELLRQAPDVARLNPEQLGEQLGETVHEVLVETAGSES